MIRDPSDGSVREEINLPANETSAIAPKTSAAGITTALPPLPTDAKESSRLKASRDWLKQYHKPKEG